MKNSISQPFSIATLRRLLWTALLAGLLAGCAAPDDFGDFSYTNKSGVKMTGVAVVQVNHSQKNVFTSGGRAPKRWPGAGTVCCMAIPEVWTPGADARIDLKVNGEWQSRRVPIERYEKIGTLYIHFFDNDEIRIVVANVGAEHPEHPIPWVPLPCEGTFMAGEDGREIIQPGVNCPPQPAQD